jgi:hypothetical protein
MKSRALKAIHYPEKTRNPQVKKLKLPLSNRRKFLFAANPFLL